jgi:hypothetical protein
MDILKNSTKQNEISYFSHVLLKKKKVIYELLSRFVGVCEKNMWQ